MVVWTNKLLLPGHGGGRGPEPRGQAGGTDLTAGLPGAPASVGGLPQASVGGGARDKERGPGSEQTHKQDGCDSLRSWVPL